MSAKRRSARGGTGGALTVLECANLGDGKHFDGNGLSLIVKGTTRAWVLRYTSPSGRRREMGLGPLSDVSVKQARDLAAAKRFRIREGVDPLEEEAAQRAEALAEKLRQKTAAKATRDTLRRVLRDYHEKHVEPVLTKKHAAQWINSVEQHLPAAILDKPIALVEPGELLDAIQTLYVEIPETARRIRQRLDTVFDHAVLRKLAPTNPAKIIARALRQRQEKSHFRALPYSEVHKLIAALRPLPGTAARALEYAILTAARTSETLEMEWSELSSSGDVWTVPAKRMKAGESHTVFLSASAQAVLARVQGLSKRWVFRSPAADAPLSNMAMLNLLRRLGMQGQTTVHGVARASFSTWANESGIARPDVIEACLAHKEGNAVRRAYNRAAFAEERRTLLTKWAHFIEPVEGTHAKARPSSKPNKRGRRAT